MYTVWHVDKYKITFKLVINRWTNEILVADICYSSYLLHTSARRPQCKPGPFHSLFLYSDPPPLVCPPPTQWLMPFPSQTFPCIIPQTCPQPSSFYTQLPAYEDGTEGSETSAYKIQTPRNHPKESLQNTQMLFRRSGPEIFDTFKNIIVLRIFPL